MKMKIIMAGIGAIVLAGGIFVFRQGSDFDSRATSISSSSMAPTQLKNVSNVSVVDGVQIIEIISKGGYQPRRSVAKAGIPTVLRFVTKATFDCSSAVTIPSMKISKILPNTGITDIEIPGQPVGTLQGTCSMGMYNFEVAFE